MVSLEKWEDRADRELNRIDKEMDRVARGIQLIALGVALPVLVYATLAWIPVETDHDNGVVAPYNCTICHEGGKK